MVHLVSARRLAAVHETVSTAREFNKPCAVVINAAPVKREDKEAPAVALSRAQFERLSVPVWSGQISQRTAFLGSLAVGARAARSTVIPLAKWRLPGSAIERSVDATNRAQADAAYMEGKAARRDGDPQRVHSGGRMNQIIRELKRQAAGEKLAPEQLKALIRAGYVYRNGDEHFLTDKGRDALAQLGVQPGDSTLADDHPPLTADCYPLPMV